MSIDKFISDGQDPKVVERIYGKIIDMLTHGESINYIALQKKPAVTLLPDSITISNKRIFLCEFTKLGLATNFEIFAWKDIKDIAFKEEIFGSKVTVIPFTGENLSIDYIPKVQARKLYQLIKDALENGKNIVEDAPVIVEKTEVKTTTSINELYKQKREHEQSEERQSSYEQAPIVPKEEEKTIVEEPIVSHVPSSQQYTPPTFEHQEPRSNPPAPTPLDPEEDELTLKLKKLKTLYDKQLITQAEYESKKSEILSQL